MLCFLAELSDRFGPLRVFDSITFRAIAAVTVAFVLVWLAAPRFIAFMLRRHATEDVDKPDSLKLNDLHKGKKNTPTMGGLVLVAAIFLTVFLFGDPANPLLWVGQGVLLGFAALGFVDDFMKLKGWGRKGMTQRQKLAGQIMLSALAAAALAWGAEAGWFRLVDVAPLDSSPGGGARLLAWYAGGDAGAGAGAAVADVAVRGRQPNPLPAAATATAAATLPPTLLVVPFTKWSGARPDLSWFYWGFVMLVLVACSNAVNFTDGLDGLAAGCSFPVTLAFGAFTYIVGNEILCGFFRIPHVALCGELTVFAAALAGALLGFLWYNAHPAEVFMGDTGSLALGAAIAFLAIATKHELVLILAGGVYVLEAGSVILQIASFKLTGRRLFRCAPFHHHMEFGGCHENHVVVRLWIAGAVLAALALGTLKMH